MSTNINIPVSHFTGDRTNTNFYYFSGGFMVAKKRSSPYNTVATYPVNTYVGAVSCIQFDGVYYWSLERNTNGFTIKKWELLSGILYQRAIFSHSNSLALKCDSYCFVVDNYHTTTTAVVTSGSNEVTVSDVSIFDVGDTIVVGPTTGYESRVVVSKSESLKKLYTDLPFTSLFSSGSDIYTSRYIHVFNKYSHYDNNKGELIRYRISDGSYVTGAPSHMYGDVRAACFYDGRLYFVKGHEVVQLSVSSSSVSVFRRTCVDNLSTDRADIVSIYGIWLHSDVLYRLQNTRVYYNSGLEEWEEETWSPYYNYIAETFPTIYQSTVYFVELKADPMFIHAVSVPSIPTSTSNITVTVLNQDRTPLPDIPISLSASTGSLSPTSGTTDSDGKFYSTYSGTTQTTEVEITATAG